MNNNESAARTRFTVDLSDYPDLVAIYLGLRVNSIRGLLPALEFGPKLKQAVKDNPPGLLRHEFLLYSLYPLHLGIRQYWQNFESLERWARSGVHAGWWKNFLQNPTGYGLWHETYFIRGGMEAIYGDVPPPLGLTAFAPIRPATGASFSSRSRLKVSGEQTVSSPIAETDFPQRELPTKAGP